MNNTDLAMQVTINVTKDGRLNVNGFPTNLQGAQQVLHGASDAITAYFIGQAKAGKLDDQGNVIESKIIPANKPILMPNVMPMNGRKDGLYKK